MSHRFKTVSIVGVGLLGASLGLALKQRGLADSVRGVGRREESLEVAKRSGAIDEGTTDFEAGVRGAELVVLCTPAAHVEQCLETVARIVEDSTVITDVASTKASICRAANAVWPDTRPFVGSHPMAGSEKFGPEHANAGLFVDAVTFVEPLESQDRHAHETVRAVWESVGSKVVEVDAPVHDAMVARTSHVPHIVAAALASAADVSGDVRPFAGSGFRDTTRIAEGRPEIWRDICLTNDEAILDGLEDVIGRLRAVADSIRSRDSENVERFFHEGRAARERVLGQ